MKKRPSSAFPVGKWARASFLPTFLCCIGGFSAAFAQKPDLRPQQILINHARIGLPQAEAQQDSLLAQMMNMVLYDTLAYPWEQEAAIALLAQSRRPQAYAFLAEHFQLEIPYARADENAFSRKAIFWCLHQYAAGNWALWPHLLRLMRTQRLMMPWDIMDLTLLLDEIVQDPAFLVVLLDGYMQEGENLIFDYDRGKVEEALEVIH